ncbi:hypothetical protein LBMAG53_32060 [Planctomycetota bacterium]|nr:hypothetical protein LBMAG53_32060 [Planctomycetota bacterium]
MRTALISCAILGLAAAEPQGFKHTAKPVVDTYCIQCHSGAKAKGDADLAQYGDGEMPSALLEKIAEVVGEGFMPPKGKPTPTVGERTALMTWLHQTIDRRALAQAGDPGQVVVRRQTNAELNYTLADLTGVAIDWTRDFPADASGGEGFSNTGQTLQMSASQIEKYLALVNRVADNALFLPGSGPVFLGSPVSTDSQQRAWIALERLDRFYAANRLTHVDTAPAGLIATYAYPHLRKETRDKFKSQGGGGTAPGGDFRFVRSLRRLEFRLDRLSPALTAYAIPQALPKEPLKPELKDRWQQLWLDLRYAAGDVRAQKISLLHLHFASKPYLVGENPRIEAGMQQKKQKIDVVYERDLVFSVPTLVPFLAGLRVFTETERKSLEDFENVQFYDTLEVPNHDAFDAFLDQYLDAKQLEALWKKVNDPSDPLTKRLGGVPPPEWNQRWTDWTAQEKTFPELVRASAHQAMLDFAARAWRRPLAKDESAALSATFTDQLTKGASYQEAMRLFVQRVLMSPHFLYRIERGRPPDTAKATPGKPADIEPLTGHELASRLSYLLWSSMPDDELLRAAAAGELDDPAKLKAQAARMRKDPRIRRLAQEFFGQWLGFYRFADFSRPNQQRFPDFTPNLRAAMLTEALDLCTDLVASDGDLRLFLHADYAYLSRELGEFYAIPRDERRWPWAPASTTAALHRNGTWTTDAARPGALSGAPPNGGEAVIAFAVPADRRPELRPGETLQAWIEVRLDPDQPAKTLAIHWATEAKAKDGTMAPSLWQSAYWGAFGGAKPATDLESVASLQPPPAPPAPTMAAAESLETFDPDKPAVVKPIEPAKKPDPAKAKPKPPEPIHLGLPPQAGAWGRLALPLGKLRLDDPRAIRAIAVSHGGGRATWGVVTFAPDPWAGKTAANPFVSAPRISLAGTQRRGMLGWGALLAINAHPLRTSPVLRGNWLLKDVLGTPTPPPPNDVPLLPEDEKNPEGLSVGQMLAKHRENQTCAACHARIDPLGIALEQFDPIGRWRDKDGNGKPIDSTSRLEDGTVIAGASGLHAYLKGEIPAKRFARRFARKLLGFALGRQVIPGDNPLLDQIDAALVKEGFRISVVLDAIVASPQFRSLRRRDGT